MVSMVVVVCVGQGSLVLLISRHYLEEKKKKKTYNKGGRKVMTSSHSL